MDKWKFQLFSHPSELKKSGSAFRRPDLIHMEGLARFSGLALAEALRLRLDQLCIVKVV